MKLHHLAAVVAVGTCLFAPAPAQGAFLIRQPIVRERFDPVYEYVLPVFLTGIPERTFVAGENVPGSSGPDFFTVYDIVDLRSATQVDVGFDPTIQNVGIDPFMTPPPFFDDPNIPNITFTFFPTAATIELPTGQPELFIFNFAFQTRDIPPPPQMSFWYGWQTSLRVGNTIVKETGFNFATVIPEPSSWALSALGLVGVVTALIRRRPAAPAA